MWVKRAAPLFETPGTSADADLLLIGEIQNYRGNIIQFAYACRDGLTSCYSQTTASARYLDAVEKAKYPAQPR